jgi:DNA-binding MarR family transcriptional regulator
MEPSELFVKTFLDTTDFFIRRALRYFLLFSKQNGFSISQAAALFLISHNESYSVSDISDALEITSPAASQLLDRLVQQGYILRSEDPDDRRHKQITLSEEGDLLLQKGLQVRRKWLEELIQTLSPDELAQLVNALNIIHEKVQQLEYQLAAGS